MALQFAFMTRLAYIKIKKVNGSLAATQMPPHLTCIAFVLATKRSVQQGIYAVKAGGWGIS